MLGNNGTVWLESYLCHLSTSLDSFRRLLSTDKTADENTLKIASIDAAYDVIAVGVL